MPRWGRCSIASLSGVRCFWSSMATTSAVSATPFPRSSKPGIWSRLPSPRRSCWAASACSSDQSISGVLSDRYGRKPVFMACILVFSVFSLASALSETTEFLAATRLLTGLGLGGGLPAAIALSSDYVPGKPHHHRRSDDGRGSGRPRAWRPRRRRSSCRRLDGNRSSSWAVCCLSACCRSSLGVFPSRSRSCSQRASRGKKSMSFSRQ